MYAMQRHGEDLKIRSPRARDYTHWNLGGSPRYSAEVTESDSELYYTVGGIPSSRSDYTMDGAITSEPIAIPPGMSMFGSELTMNLYPIRAVVDGWHGNSTLYATPRGEEKGRRTMNESGNKNKYNSNDDDKLPGSDYPRYISIVPMKCVGSGETNMYSRHQLAIDQFGVQGTENKYTEQAQRKKKRGWNTGAFAEVTD